MEPHLVDDVLSVGRAGPGNARFRPSLCADAQGRTIEVVVGTAPGLPGA